MKNKKEREDNKTLRFAADYHDRHRRHLREASKQQNRINHNILIFN
jgi:hypothetical protein